MPTVGISILNDGVCDLDHMGTDPATEKYRRRKDLEKPFLPLGAKIVFLAI